MKILALIIALIFSASSYASVTKGQMRKLNNSLLEVRSAAVNDDEITALESLQEGVETKTYEMGRLKQIDSLDINPDILEKWEELSAANEAGNDEAAQAIRRQLLEIFLKGPIYSN